MGRCLVFHHIYEHKEGTICMMMITSVYLIYPCWQVLNIGTQSVQELFFCDSIRRTVYSNDLVKFFGCDIQQERNWEFMMYIPCYIGNGKIAK